MEQEGRSDSSQFMDAKDLQSFHLDEEWAWQIFCQAFLYLTSGLAAAVFPATAGNEEIGSHQNMQALSSSTHLSKDHRQGSIGLERLNSGQIKQVCGVY